MRANMANLGMQDEDCYSPQPKASLQSRKLDNDWDYVTQSISNINQNSYESNGFARICTRSQSVNMSMTDFDDSGNSQVIGRQISQDMENQSTQPSSILSRESSIQSFTEEPICAYNKLPTKGNAPTKTNDKHRYKLAAEQINREQMSMPSFLSRLNETVEYPERYAMLPQSRRGMPLNQHLDALSEKFANDVSDSHNDIKILDSHMSMCIDNINSQRIGDCDKISIIFSEHQNYSEDFHEYFELTENRNIEETNTCFFEKLRKFIGQKFCEMPKLKIKFNNEPIFPINSTLDYLGSLYEGSDVKVKTINECQTHNRQRSIDVYF